MAADSARWYLLMHQIPTKPDYLRVKIGRRLQRIGAVPIRNGVYALPVNDTAQEDLAWTLSEVVAGGGEGSICEARFLQGISDEDIERRFREARDADYAPLVDELRAMLARPEPAAPPEVEKVRRRLGELAPIDFFDAARRREAEALLAAVEARGAVIEAQLRPAQDWTGRLWVTRTGVRIDRIASAWLIRRFVDPAARFKFVDPRGYVAAAGEVRYDMNPAEFTHEGEDCTFEVLVRRMGLTEPGLPALAQVIHDIDLKDARYARAEAAGIGAMIDGVASGTDDDEERLRQGFVVFDAVLRTLARG